MLDWPFEAVTEMMHIIKNDESVQMIIFNDQEDYTVFQFYTLEETDQYEYETVWYNLRQKKD